MSKQVKDILFPLNVLGKDKKCVKWERNFLSTNSYLVQWVGDALQVCHTTLNLADSRVEPTIIRKTGGGSFLYTVATGINYPIMNNTVYFNCTNVTSLIVDGEQLI